MHIHYSLIFENCDAVKIFYGYFCKYDNLSMLARIEISFKVGNSETPS